MSENGTELPAGCRDGYTGRLCSLCDDGYFMQFRRCQPCPEAQSSSIALLVAIAFALLLAGGVIFKLRAFLPVPIAKIVVSFLQVVGSANVAFRIQWPPEFEDAIDTMKVRAGLTWCAGISQDCALTHVRSHAGGDAGRVDPHPGVLRSADVVLRLVRGNTDHFRWLIARRYSRYGNHRLSAAPEIPRRDEGQPAAAECRTTNGAHVNGPRTNCARKRSARSAWAAPASVDHGSCCGELRRRGGVQQAKTAQLGAHLLQAVDVLAALL